jgi:hypothetical protein
MGIFDPILDPLLGDNDLSGVRSQIEQNRALYDKIDMPEYKDWVPELYNNESAQYKLTSDDPMARSAQLSALSKMAGLADTGLSDADQAGFAKAANQASQIARSGNAAALQNAQSRGVAGSGLEFLMREQANQDAAQRAQDAGLETAANAARQRAAYNQAFMQGTSQMRDQDYNTNRNNAGIINQFNQANTQARNQTNQANTGLRNDAFQYNQGLKDKTFQNQIGKADRIAGINNEIGKTYTAEQAADNQRNGAILGAGIGAVGAYFGKKA